MIDVTFERGTPDQRTTLEALAQLYIHDFTEFLRADPRFYYDKPEDLVNSYRIIVKKIDPELAHEFGKLPRLPYGVCEIPDFKAPSQTVDAAAPHG